MTDISFSSAATKSKTLATGTDHILNLKLTYSWHRGLTAANRYTCYLGLDIVKLILSKMKTRSLSIFSLATFGIALFSSFLVCLQSHSDNSHTHITGVHGVKLQRLFLENFPRIRKRMQLKCKIYIDNLDNIDIKKPLISTYIDIDMSVLTQVDKQVFDVLFLDPPEKKHTVSEKKKAIENILNKLSKDTESDFVKYREHFRFSLKSYFKELTNDVAKVVEDYNVEQNKRMHEMQRFINRNQTPVSESVWDRKRGGTASFL